VWLLLFGNKLRDWNLIVSFDQINVRKNGAARHVVIEGLHVQQGGMVTALRRPYSPQRQPGAVFFGHKVQGRRAR
jgi:hypothetical protein